MKITKKAVSYVLVFLMVFSSFTILPSEFWGWANVSAVDLTTEESNAIPLYTEGKFTYSIINDNAVKLVKYNGGSSVVIPNVTKGSECPELANKKVTAIGDNVFADKTLTSVTIGKNITSIGNCAFYNNRSLAKLDLSLCTGLKSIGDYAFYYNNSLKTLDLSLCTGLTSIGKYAFTNNYELTTLKLPNSLKTIGANAFSSCYKLTKVVTGKNIESIGNNAFNFCHDLKTVNIEGGNSAIIGESAFNNCSTLKSVTIGNGVKGINQSAFSNCFKLEKVEIGKDITHMGENLFWHCFQLEKVSILGRDLTTLYNNSIPNNEVCVIYCYEESTTYSNIVNKGYINLTLYERRKVYPTDIKVNGVSIDNFSKDTQKYVVYVDDATEINIVPVFAEENVKYTVTSNNHIHKLDILDEDDRSFITYTLTINQYGYEVIGDVRLVMKNIGATKVKGNVALPAGTYKIKIARGPKQFGYNKVVADSCNGLTLNEKYSSYITLKATGGIYTFQFDTKTKGLVIKRDSNLPNKYLVGDLGVALKAVKDKRLYTGTQQLPAGTYKFKVSIDGKEYGYDKALSNYSQETIAVNSEHTGDITINTTGALYVFTLDTYSNELTIYRVDINNQYEKDVHITGTVNLELNITSSTGEAVGYKRLSAGCYTFMLYNHGVVYTSGAVIQNKGGCTLSSKNTALITLDTTGGYYKFIFNKETGFLEIKWT
ncbi:MAG: leucine-rich repeat protein [Acutalibacteraceae bacterium]